MKSGPWEEFYETLPMTTDSADAVEIELALDEGLLARLDRLRTAPGYGSRSAVVADAIAAAAERRDGGVE